MLFAPLLFTLAVNAPSPVAVVPKLALLESGRYEVKTTSGLTMGGSWSETQTASRTKVTVTAEIPLAGQVIDADTTFEVNVGDFSGTAQMKGDPSFKPGGTSAHLVQTDVGIEKAAVRTVIGKMDLKWDAHRLIVKIVADSPNGPSAAAASFKDGQVGSFEGLTKASISCGARKVDFQVPIKGRIARKSVDVMGLSGSATMVDLKGEAKAT